MHSAIRHPKDFWTGVIFLSFGLAAVVIALGYPLGTTSRMGPAFFPIVLGSLLALIGAIAIARAFMHDGEPVGRFYFKEIFLILGSVLLFGYLMRGAGLVPAVALLVLMSAFASARFHLGRTLLLAAGLAVFAVVVFVKLLGLPMPVIGPWLSF